MNDFNVMTVRWTKGEAEAIAKLSEATELTNEAVLRQALRFYQLVHHRIADGETIAFSGDKARQIDFAGYGFPIEKEDDLSYAAAEEMLLDLIPRSIISDTVIRVARDHMVSFARQQEKP